MRSVALALGAGYGTFALNAIAYAVSVPLLLRWLGAERLGTWMVLLQGLTVVSLATGWLASPIVREVAGIRLDADPQCRQLRLRGLVASASIFYAVLGLALVLGGGIAAWLLRRYASGGLAGEVAWAVWPVAVSAAVALQTGLVTSVLTGHNRLHVTYGLLGLQTVASTAGGLLAVSLTPSLWALASGHLAGFIITNVVASVVAGPVLVGYLRPRAFDPGLLRALVRVGSGYLGYSLAFLATQSELFLVTAALGPHWTAVYGIAQRIFDYLLNLMRRIADAMLPTMAEADAAGDRGMLVSLHAWSVGVTVAGSLAVATLLLSVGPALVRLWVGDTALAPYPVFVGLAMAMLVSSWTHANVVLPFSANRIAAFVPSLLVDALLRCAIGWWTLMNVGVAGLPFAVTLAMLLSTAWTAPREAGRLTARSLREVIAGQRAHLLLALATVALWSVALGTADAAPWLWGLSMSGAGALALIHPWATFLTGPVRRRLRESLWRRSRALLGIR